MRTHLLRGVALLAVLFALSSSPAEAQSLTRGTVVDEKGQPVPDAVILFEAQGANRKTQTKTNGKGEFLQIGLQSGEYKVTASKEGVGTETLPARVTQGPNPPMTFTLRKPGATAALAPTEGSNKEALAKLQASATAAVAAMKAGQYDEAIAKYNDVLAVAPTCAECYYNIGVSYANKKDYPKAEEAFKKSIELKPDSADAYTGLAGLYNAQKKFDLAAEASAKAVQLSGAGAAAAGGGGGGAEASYNQGVILFNSGKFAEAKTLFEAATKADPNMALAQYQLGMTALNLGLFPEAVTALEAYLKADPNGAKAAEVKAALPALQKMIQK
jgi:cytochrome c-type biogenesis protein CcmH/NrfG